MIGLPFYANLKVQTATCKDNNNSKSKAATYVKFEMIWVHYIQCINYPICKVSHEFQSAKVCQSWEAEIKLSWQCFREKSCWVKRIHCGFYINLCEKMMSSLSLSSFISLSLFLKWYLYHYFFCECSIRSFILLRFLVNVMGNVFQSCMHIWMAATNSNILNADTV